ncbi:MAG: phosphatidate cytidylyltransferase [Cyanobacteria bacterium J06642_2]
MTSAISSYSIIVQTFYYALWLGAVFGLAELLRSHQVDGELVRKVIHIGVGNIIILAWILDVPRTLGIVVSIGFSLVALLSYRVKLLQSLNGVNRQSFGTFFYALSIALAITWFWLPGLKVCAVLGVMVMTWGDALAAIVGQRWGHHGYELAGIRKSWEGSLTMGGASAAVIAAVLLWSQSAWACVPLPLAWIGAVALGLGAISALLESLSWRGIDNITVPLATCWLSYGVLTQLGAIC